MNMLKNINLSFIAFFFLFLLVITLGLANFATASQCETLAFGVCNSSYYPPVNNRPAIEWAYYCENSTNTTLTAPYCYYNTGTSSNPAYCGHYADAYGGYAGCISNEYWNINSGLVQFAAVCPSGYSEITPSSVGQTLFYDCLNAAAQTSSLGNNYPCCIRNTAPAPLCSDIGGSCSSGPTRFTCQTDQVIASSQYECSYACCLPIQCNDLTDTNSYCTPNTQYYCKSGYNSSYGDNAVQNSCSNGGSSYSVCCSQTQTCNTGSVSTSACYVPNPTTNTCGYAAGTENYKYTTYVHPNCGQPATSGNGYTCTASSSCNQSPYSAGCGTIFYNNCSNNYSCINNNTCVTNIYAYVYIDYNHTGTNSGGGLNGVTVTDNGGNYFTTGSNGWNTGEVVFSQKATGNYTITATAPTSWYPTSGTITTSGGNVYASNGVSLTNSSGNVTTNFYMTPLYNISGTVFSDTNKDEKLDNNEAGYGGGTIHITGGPTPVNDITVASNGTWSTPTNLYAGTYTVSYTTALPTDYTFTTPSSYSVTVGNPAGSIKCATGGSLDAVCGGTNGGSISGLNIGVTNENTWTQTVCTDVRNDSGTYTNLIPSAPSCGGANGPYNSITNGDCTTGAGILYTCNATPDLGLGYANTNNWQAGGAAANQQECYVNQGLNIIRTSYNYLLTTMQQSGITPIDMATVCSGGLGNCTLPANLAKGVYQANGDVYLNTFTFPVDPTTPQGFIFLINGNLHIMGNILVPRGSVAAFSTSGSIYVDKSVGQAVNATTLANGTVNDPNIEGLYSADANFIVGSYGAGTAVCNADGTPLDLKLNVIGSIITNAAQAGGSFTDNRDLCIYDNQCATVSGGDGNPGTPDGGLGLSYILTLYADGKFLNHQVFNWQESQP